VIETCQPSVERRFERNNGNAGARECSVENGHGWEEEEQKCEENGTEEELIEVVVTAVDAVPKDVALFAAEEVKERNDDGELPVVDPRRGNVKGVDVDRQQRDQVGEKRDGQTSAHETGQADETNDVW